MDRGPLEFEKMLARGNFTQHLSAVYIPLDSFAMLYYKNPLHHLDVLLASLRELSTYTRVLFDLCSFKYPRNV